MTNVMNAENEPPKFTIGDKVRFTKMTVLSRHKVNLRILTGTIVKFSVPLGTKACIRYHAGNITWQPVTEISAAP